MKSWVNELAWKTATDLHCIFLFCNIDEINVEKSFLTRTYLFDGKTMTSHDIVYFTLYYHFHFTPLHCNLIRTQPYFKINKLKNIEWQCYFNIFFHPILQQTFFFVEWSIIVVVFIHLRNDSVQFVFIVSNKLIIQCSYDFYRNILKLKISQKKFKAHLTRNKLWYLIVFYFSVNIEYTKS